MAYDLYTVDANGRNLIDMSVYPNPSTQLQTVLTSGKVFFAGPKALSISRNVPIPLYAPNTWGNGSSYCHLDHATYRNTSNALMTPFQSNGVAIHYPGNVTLGILADMGWTIQNMQEESTPPVATEVTKDIQVYTIDGQIRVQAPEMIGDEIAIYNLLGQLVHKARIRQTATDIPLPRGQVYILQIGQRTCKIL
jgi:hypothetical protein